MEKTPDKRACRYVETPIGPLTLVACGGALVEARFGGFPIAHESPVLDMAERELKEYFARQRRDFEMCIRDRPSAAMSFMPSSPSACAGR